MQLINLLIIYLINYLIIYCLIIYYLNKKFMAIYAVFFLLILIDHLFCLFLSIYMNEAQFFGAERQSPRALQSHGHDDGDASTPPLPAAPPPSQPLGRKRECQTCQQCLKLYYRQRETSTCI